MSFSGVSFGGYVCNASGPLDSTLEELECIARSGSSAIVMKSCTILPRKGNKEPRYARLPFGSIQSMGLPNRGYRYYANCALKLAKYNKPIIASIAGFSVEEYDTMIRAFQRTRVSCIEVNLSCPNVEGKSQVGYDFSQTEEILKKIYREGNKPLGIKLPPYYEAFQYERMADLIRRYSVKFITCVNSVGNTLVIDSDTEAPVIKPKKGFGGLCGAYIKPVALANVRTFFELLEGSAAIFGVGGIETGEDAFAFLLAGADAVQVGTVFEKEGCGCFSRIEKELQTILKKKGYRSIGEAKGKLKYL